MLEPVGAPAEELHCAVSPFPFECGGAGRCGVEQNCMVQPAATGHSLTLITVCTVDIFEHAARYSLGCTGKGKVECSSCQPQEPFSKTCRRSGSVGRRRASVRWADRGGVGRRRCGSPLRMVGSPGMASFQSREFISTTTLASPVLSSQPESSMSTITPGLCGQCGGTALRSFQDTPCPPPNPQLTLWLLGLRQSSTVLIILLTWLQATGRCGRPCESGAGCRVRRHWPDPSRPQLPPPRQSGA